MGKRESHSLRAKFLLQDQSKEDSIRTKELQTMRLYVFNLRYFAVRLEGNFA